MKQQANTRTPHPTLPPERGGLATAEELIAETRAGRMVIIIDDETRENEGDLVLPAAMVTSEAINFMATHGRGLICLPLDPSIADRLALPPMTERNTSTYGTAFTVSIGAAAGITTGISAADRARTIAVAADPASGPDALTMPGHVFPLRAAAGGVLARPGHTEAAVDLARLAGFAGAAVICEILNEDGSMARLPDLRRFAAKHNLRLGTIADLIAYRKEQSA